MDSLSVHAYITKCQNNEAQVEEKRKRENEEGGPSKRVTRGSGKKDIGPSQVPLPHNQPPQEVSMGEAPTKTKQEKEKSKGKSPLYKLQSDIEAATDLKKVLEERILNSKVEFTLGEVLGIAKKEFHDEIIDIIRRKRQSLIESIPSQGEASTSKSHGIQVQQKEERENVVECNQSTGGARQVRFVDEDDEKEVLAKSHYSKSHWARATTETLVKIGDLEEPYVALIDHGSEINLMAKNLYNKCKWPMDMDHGWMIRAANNSSGELYAACPNVKVTIGDVKDDQNFFIQEMSSYPLILGQPYITAVRMETKVLDDGSAYARIRSKDGKKAVQFLTVCINHERNRETLREQPLPKINREFMNYREMRDFRQVPL